MIQLTELEEATFIRRVSRFSALVERVGSMELTHVPNSGRLRELFPPGRRVYLAPRWGKHRKTNYDLSLVAVGDILVSADARVPGALIYCALVHGQLPHFKGYRSVQKEVFFGGSRLDLLLQGNARPCLIEVKSITLVVQGRGLFPDAPTARGRRHIQSLIQALSHGYRAAAIFVIQREDAHAFSPNDETDTAFGNALREAALHGVEIYAYRCQVTPKEIKLAEEVPVLL